MMKRQIGLIFISIIFCAYNNSIEAQTVVFTENFNAATINPAIWTTTTFRGRGPGQCAGTPCVNPCEGCSGMSATLSMPVGCSTFGAQLNVSAFSSGANCNNVGSTARVTLAHTFATPLSISNPIITVSGNRIQASGGPFEAARAGIRFDIDGIDGAGTAQTNFIVFIEIDRPPGNFDQVRDWCAACTQSVGTRMFIGNAGACANRNIDLNAILGWNCVKAINNMSLIAQSGNCVIGAASSVTYRYLFDDIQITSFPVVGCFPLPVQLLSFTANWYGDNYEAVKLDWQTASETNNDYFEVERSTDAINFKSVLKISGAGNSNQILTYSDFDKSPIDGKVIYYRLKQVDFDGSISYSGVEVLYSKKDLNIISLYPNPVVDYLTYKVNSSTSKEVKISVFDNLGQLVLSENIHLNKGLTEQKINVKNLISGNYIIQILSKMNIDRKSFVVK